MRQPLVSVCVLVYNQVQYLEKCLDSILNQETTFPFEVLVHDDASRDGSTEVIIRYAEEYPGIVIPVIQSENQYSKDRCIHRLYREYLYPKARGRYIAYCEGDDYWLTNNKLQRQFEILESNLECPMCLHRVCVVNERGESSGWGYPQNEIKTGVLSSYDFMKGLTDGYFFHTTSFMTRYSVITRLIENQPQYYSFADVDDVPLLLYFGQLGNVYYINDTMSCYRRNSIGSWTEYQRGNKERIIAHKWKMIDMYRAYDQFTNGEYHELVEHWINNERFMIAEHEHDFVEMDKAVYKVFMNKRGLRFKIRVKVGKLKQSLALMAN